jgi:hypothetical protein
MTKLKLLTAAALLATAVTTPVMAQDVPSRAQVVNHQNDPSNPYYRHRAYRQGSGFWPGDVAAGIVGGAIGTAGAIATAPFRGADSYAYYGGYGYGDSYAARNGFVCQPGTTFRGDDGRRHLCQ